MCTVVILATGALSSPADPAGARVCADVTIIQNGVPDTQEHCESLLDDWPEQCVAPEAERQGYGGKVTLCAPSA